MILTSEGNPRITVVFATPVGTFSGSTIFDSISARVSGGDYSAVEAGHRVRSTKTGSPNIPVWGVVNAVSDRIYVDEWVGGQPTDGQNFVVDGKVIDLPYCEANELAGGLVQSFTPNLLIHNLYQYRKEFIQNKYSYAISLDYASRLESEVLQALDPALNLEEGDSLIIYPHGDQLETYYNVMPAASPIEVSRYVAEGVAHSLIKFAFVGLDAVPFKPIFTLTDYSIIMRSIEASAALASGATVSLPATLTTPNYFSDMRHRGGVYIALSDFSASSLKATADADLGGRGLTLIAIDPAVNAIAGSTLRVTECTLNTSYTRVNYAVPFPTDAYATIRPRVRALNGTEVIVSSFDKNGFYAKATANGTACRALSVYDQSWRHYQTKVSPITGTVGEDWTTLLFSLMPSNSYYYDIESADNYELEFRNERQNSIEVRSTQTAQVNGFAIYQQS